MLTMAQRIEQLRTEKNVSRMELSGVLGLPRNALEKFETGRQTPSREQQEKLADYFGVSVAYLRCESDDPQRQETWMDLAYTQEEEVTPPPAPRKRPPAPAAAAQGEEGGVFSGLLGSRAFQEAVQKAVLEALRSPEGQKLLTQTVRKELSRREGQR